MMNRSKIASRALGAVVSLTAAGVLAVPFVQSASAADVEEPLTGAALVKSLDIKLEEKMPEGCQAFIEVGEPAGYCLDGHYEDIPEAWVLGEQLRGRTPSEAEVREFDLTLQYSSASTDEERAAIAVELEALEG